MYVKTDYDGCDYITAGKVYEVNPDYSLPFIRDDSGDSVLIAPIGEKCCHLSNEGIWTICDKEGNEL